jgi:hypothetical protein
MRMSAKDRLDTANTARQTLIQSVTGAVVVAGVAFTAAGLVYTARTLHATEQGQITDRYAKTIEQLGSDKLDVRLGAIYALERLATDSPPDSRSIYDVLCAFVREHHPKPGAKLPTKPATDIQAALTVIGRRRPADRPYAPDLNAIRARGAHLIGANLAEADLTGVDLTDATIISANLRDAKLRGAKLSDTFLGKADLRGANLAGADLNGANLADADLRGAFLTHADLRYANLHGADLRSALLAGANLGNAIMGLADLRDAYLRGDWEDSGRDPAGGVDGRVYDVLSPSRTARLHPPQQLSTMGRFGPTVT